MLSREVLGIIADNLSKAGWSWGCASALDSEGRTIWIADAHHAATESAAVLCGTSPLGNRSNVVNNMKIIAIALLILVTLELAQAEPHQSRERNRNYILRRQQVMPGLGTTTTRLIYGKREIDIYRNGLMFEKDNVVGVSKR
jgi:hypothetical protein